MKVLERIRALPRGLLAALAACALTRALWLLGVQPEPIADYAFYYTRAAELAAGLGYRYQGHPTAFFPVGTSLILAGPFALFGPSLPLAKGLSLIAWLATVLLTWRLGGLVAGTRVGTIAALIVALHPDFIAYTGLVGSENFFVPLLLGSLYAFCLALQPQQPHARLLLLAGLLMGAAVLVRSTAIILLPLLALLVLLTGPHGLRARIQLASLFIAATLLTVAPWIARNGLVMGLGGLSTNGGISLWWGNNPHASGGFPLRTQQPVQDLSTVRAEVDSHRHYSAEAFKFMASQPLRWLALAPAKAAFLFGSQSSDIGYALRHRYEGGPGAIEFHPGLGDASRAHEALDVERPLTRLESMLIGGYYRVAGGPLRWLWLQALWAVGMLGCGLMWWHCPRQRAVAATLLLVPAAWVLFHVTLGNGQPRYLMSVAALPVIGTAYLAAGLAARARLARSSQRHDQSPDNQHTA